MLALNPAALNWDLSASVSQFIKLQVNLAKATGSSLDDPYPSNLDVHSKSLILGKRKAHESLNTDFSQRKAYRILFICNNAGMNDRNDTKITLGQYCKAGKCNCKLTFAEPP